MRLLEDHNLADYLRDVGLIDRDEQVSVRLLAGGVSNVVFYVQRGQGRGDGFVFKQARGRLRVAQPWFCSVERVWREVEVLRVCDRLLAASRADCQSARERGSRIETGGLAIRPTTCVPAVLFEDRENYAFAMAAAPPGHRTWKEMLLAGEFSSDIASACGELLGRLHAGTWRDDDLAERIGDRQFFRDLRVDPYYRRVAEVHADLKPVIDGLIPSLEENAHCLVHGDFSPKNLLVWDGRRQESPPTVMLIDCEVGHFGDPAFDLGFFLSHLVLKAVFRRRRESPPAIPLGEAFWASYANILLPAISSSDFDLLQQRAVLNLGACLLSRVDGKSPVEYLTDDEEQELVRRLARTLFDQPPLTISDAVTIVNEIIDTAS